MSFSVKQFSSSIVQKPLKASKRKQTSTQPLGKSKSQPNIRTSSRRKLDGIPISQPTSSTAHQNNVSTLRSNSYEIVQVEEGILFVVFLPYILSDSYNQIRQPLLFKIREKQLLDFGFSLPFSNYFDTVRNIFRVTIGEKSVDGQIISTGKNQLQVKANLEKVIGMNQIWKDSLTIVSNLCFVWVLEHCPLENSQEVPKHLVMDLKTFENFISQFKSLRQIQKPIPSKESDKEIQLNQEKEINKKKQIFESEQLQAGGSSTQNVKITKTTKKQSDDDRNLTKTVICDCNPIKTRKKEEEIISQLEVIRNRLLERKQVLSQLDLPSLIMADLIDAVDNLCTITSLKDKQDKKELNQIPESDKTFVDKKKGLIYVEGILPFNLDKYKNALLAGKSKPLTLAYQLVKHCFPEEYILNVTLGKKFYQIDEFSDMLELKEDYKGKFPLPFIWGFKDPMEAPLQGEFDLNLGLERVRALIVHILRVCEIFEFDEDLARSIRGRLVRELNAQNSAAKNGKSSMKDKDKEHHRGFKNARIDFSEYSEEASENEITESSEGGLYSNLFLDTEIFDDEIFDTP